MHKKGISLNSLKNFCLTVPIKFVGEHFCVSKEFWYRKFPSKGAGKLHGFVEIFYLTGPKKLRQGTILCFRKFLVGKKFLWIRGWGGYHNFPSRSFCLTVPKYLIGEHFGFSEKTFHRKFSSIGGGHHGFVEIFCLTGPKRKAL